MVYTVARCLFESSRRIKTAASRTMHHKGRATDLRNGQVGKPALAHSRRISVRRVDCLLGPPLYRGMVLTAVVQQSFLQTFARGTQGD